MSHRDGSKIFLLIAAIPMIIYFVRSPIKYDSSPSIGRMPAIITWLLFVYPLSILCMWPLMKMFPDVPGPMIGVVDIALLSVLAWWKTNAEIKEDMEFRKKR